MVGFTADGDVFGAGKKERTRKQRLVLRGRSCGEGKTPQRREEASGRAMRPAGRLLAVLHGSGTSGQPTRCGEASLNGLFSLKRTILTLWSFVSVVSEKRPEKEKERRVNKTEQQQGGGSGGMGPTNLQPSP